LILLVDENTHGTLFETHLTMKEHIKIWKIFTHGTLFETHLTMKEHIKIWKIFNLVDFVLFCLYKIFWL
jgi:hypothetical protein